MRVYFPKTKANADRQVLGTFPTAVMCDVIGPLAVASEFQKSWRANIHIPTFRNGKDKCTMKSVVDLAMEGMVRLPSRK
jgi:hypothetical protein